MSDGTSIRLRSLLRSEQRHWKQQCVGPLAEQYSDDVLIAMCIVDADGSQLITCEDALTGFFDQWDAGECQSLLRACLELCHVKLGEPAADKQLDAAIKN